MHLMFLSIFKCVQKKVVQGKTKTTFVLLSAPWNILCYYAEEISLRVPLQVKCDGLRTSQSK